MAPIEERLHEAERRKIIQIIAPLKTVASKQIK
jgi:hypothetical protein